MPFHCIDIVITTWSIVCHCRHIERIVIIGIATIEKRTNLEIVENLGKTYQRISVGVGRFRQGRSITAEVVIMEVGKYGIINRTVTCPYHTLTNVISYNLRTTGRSQSRIPTTTDTGVGRITIRVGRNTRTCGIDKHLRTIREYYKHAFTGSCIDEMNIHHTLLPGRNRLTYLYFSGSIFPTSIRTNQK